MRARYERYVNAAYRRPWLFLAVAVAVTALSVIAATRIELHTDFRELLPRNYRSIKDLEHIEKRAGGTGTLAIVAESDDREANIRFARDLARVLRAFPADEIRWIDETVQEERAFFEKNKLLYVDTDDLVTLRDRLRAKIDEERRKHDPLELGLEPVKPAAPLDVEAYRKRYQEKLREFDKYPDG